MRPCSASRAALPALLVGLAACGSPAPRAAAPQAPVVEEPAPGAAPRESLEERFAPAPWTSAFLEPAALLADTVRIEGPPGLLEHAVLTHDPAYRVEVRTTSEGFLQRARTERADVPVRAQLDALQVMALREVVVLERPGPVPVTVEARGDAFWKDPATGEERRDATLRLVGEVETPTAEPEEPDQR